MQHLNCGASVILLSSFVHSLAAPEISIYAATKAAVKCLARTLSADLQSSFIRVNSISPGPVDTPLFDRMGYSPLALQELKEAMANRIFLKRMAQPTEIAKAALFLASDHSSYMNGQDLILDGGV